MYKSSRIIGTYDTVILRFQNFREINFYRLEKKSGIKAVEYFFCENYVYAVWILILSVTVWPEYTRSLIVAGNKSQMGPP